MREPISARGVGLLVIDMQRGFCARDSQMGRSVGVEAQRAAIPAIARLIGLCRHLDLPVLWSQQLHLPEDQTRARRRLRSHAQRQGFLPCLRGSGEEDFDPEVLPLMSPQDLVVQKHRASVFYATNLEVKLRMLGVDLLLIAGCNTEFCVESTVRDAYARDLDLIILEDAVAGIQPDFHADSLRKFQAYFGEVMRVDELEGLLVPA